MSFIVVAVGIVFVGFGVLGVTRPQTLTRLVSLSWRAPVALYLTMGARLIFGIALVGVASVSRFPSVLLFIGVLSIFTAVLAPLIGFDRLERFAAWWLRRPQGLIRAWAAVAAGLGGFLVCAVW